MSAPEETIRAALESLRDCGDRPGMYDEGEAALAALKSLLADRDEWKAKFRVEQSVRFDFEATEARLAQATQALQEIAELPKTEPYGKPARVHNGTEWVDAQYVTFMTTGVRLSRAQEIARAALVVAGEA